MLGRTLHWYANANCQGAYNRQNKPLRRGRNPHLSFHPAWENRWGTCTTEIEITEWLSLYLPKEVSKLWMSSLSKVEPVETNPNVVKVSPHSCDLLHLNMYVHICAFVYGLVVGTTAGTGELTGMTPVARRMMMRTMMTTMTMIRTISLTFFHQ